MPTDVPMPQMGESIFEGTIVRWLKQPGDAVEEDEPLLEISTDKVDVEIPAPAAGILSEICFPEGATVQVNTVLAVIGGPVTNAVPAAAPKAQLAPPQVAAPKAQLAAPQVAAPKAQLAAPQVAAPKAQLAAPQVPQLAAPQVPPQARSIPPKVVAGGRLRSSPLVRRIAHEHNIDLAHVHGTGSDGRITKEDILHYLSQPAASMPVQPKTKSAASQVPPSDLPGQVVPMTKMRAIIAQRMLESKRISPHVHSVYKVDMTRIARLRALHRAAFERQHGIKLTYMPFIAAAAVQALRSHPILNASLVDANIHYHAHVNLGIAVALDWGLIVPVVQQAERQSFAQLALAIQDLAGRARSKKLQPSEVEGSTFTLTNAGVFGGEFGTPILNQPEAAILAIGGLRKEPVVLTDAEGNDAIAIRSVQYFCLGFDHRLIDGADSGRFMSDFKRTLETWDRDLD